MPDLSNVEQANQQLAEPLLRNCSSDVNSITTTTNQIPASSSDPNAPTRPRTSPTKMSSSFIAAVFIAVLPMFLFGYSTGVMNAPEKVIFPNHSLEQWSIAVSSFCVGGFVGANISGGLADKYGRRPCLLVLTGYLNIVAGFLHVLSPNMLVLIIARIIVGISGGAATVLTPMYLGEIAPKDIRGSTGTMTQLSCVLGILFSILTALPFCSEERWRIIFVPIPLTAILFVVAGQFLLPESPRWLLTNHYVARQQEARDTIRRFRNYSDNEDIGDDGVELENVGMATQREETPTEETTTIETDDNPPPNNSNESVTTMRTNGTTPTELPTSSFRSFAFNPRNRIPLASSILFPIAQQLSGINAVFYYSTSFFEGVIANPQNGTIAAFAVNVIATMVAVLIMDRFGRKLLLSLSAGGMFACCILLTLSLKDILPKFITVLCVMVYISFFEIGLGCIPFFIASEMIESKYLGRVQSISMSSNWFSNFIVGMAFPYMDKYLGAFSFLPFAVVLCGTVLYSAFVLPETRGKSLREIREELEEAQARRGGHQPVASSPTEAEIAFV